MELEKLNTVPTFEQMPNMVFAMIGQIKNLTEIVSSMTTNTANVRDDNFIGVAEASKLLGIATQSVYQMVCAKKLPHYKVGSRTRFLEAELIEWIKSHRNATLLEIDQQAEEYISKRML